MIGKIREKRLATEALCRSKTMSRICIRIRWIGIAYMYTQWYFLLSQIHMNGILLSKINVWFGKQFPRCVDIVYHIEYDGRENERDRKNAFFFHAILSHFLFPSLVVTGKLGHLFVANMHFPDNFFVCSLSIILVSITTKQLTTNHWC